MLNYGATWRYLATGPDQGSMWRAPSFDDSAWPSGAANLGFKNKNTTTIPSTTGRVTYYFRTNVTIAPGNPLQSAELSLIRDDGAVVYVNGVEVARSNMPTVPLYAVAADTRPPAVSTGYASSSVAPCARA